MSNVESEAQHRCVVWMIQYHTSDDVRARQGVAWPTTLPIYLTLLGMQTNATAETVFVLVQGKWVV